MVPRSHKAECRERMEKILSQTEEGEKRKDRHEEKMKIQTEEQPSGSGDLRQKRARDQEDDGEDEVRAQEFQCDSAGTKRNREEGDQGDEERGSGRIAVDSQLSNVMGELAALEDMCEPMEPSLQKHYNEHRFYDENTGEELDPVLVAKACEDELQRFEKMKVYRLVLKTEAKQGKIAKVKWVHENCPRGPMQTGCNGVRLQRTSRGPVRGYTAVDCDEAPLVSHCKPGKATFEDHNAP
jgi:hypothetical protein